MISVVADFEKRVSEIEIYFSLLENIEEKDAQLYFPNRQSKKYQPYNTELIKVLKANLFLALLPSVWVKHHNSFNIQVRILRRRYSSSLKP